MKAVHGRELGKLLLEALDLDTARARRIRIDCPIDGAAVVEVEYIRTFEDVTAFADHFKKYRTVERTEWETFRLAESGDAA